MLTKREWALLGPAATRVRALDREWWWSLKYQTQMGPKHYQFPYYPAAVLLAPIAHRVLLELSKTDRDVLVQEWHSNQRDPSLRDEDAIIRRYGAIVLSIVIRRAEAAGNRTSNW